jgi:hypothetical protein
MAKPDYFAETLPVLDKWVLAGLRWRIFEMWEKFTIIGD